MREFPTNQKPEHYYHDQFLEKGLDSRADIGAGSERGTETHSLTPAESELVVKQVAEVIPVEQPEARLPVAQ